MKCIERTVIILIFFIFLLTYSQLIYAQTQIYAKKGFFISVGVPYVSIQGDFNGYDILSDGQELFILPSFSGKMGFAGSIGHNGGRTAVSLNYQRIALKGDFSYEGESETFDSNYSMIGIVVKRHYFVRNPFQTFLGMGVNVPFVNIKQGSVNISLQEGNARYWGIGFNLEGGLTFYITRQVFFNCGVGYRLMGYQWVKGVDEQRKDASDIIINKWKRHLYGFIAAGGFSIEISTGFVF
jgi:hypothetical protein